MLFLVVTTADWYVPPYCHTMGPWGVYHQSLVIELSDTILYWYNMVHTWLRLVQCGIYFAQYGMPTTSPAIYLATVGTMWYMLCKVYYAPTTSPAMYSGKVGTMWHTNVQYAPTTSQLHTLLYQGFLCYITTNQPVAVFRYSLLGCSESQYQCITILGVYTLVKYNMYSWSQVADTR